MFSPPSVELKNEVMPIAQGPARRRARSGFNPKAARPARTLIIEINGKVHVIDIDEMMAIAAEWRASRRKRVLRRNLGAGRSIASVQQALDIRLFSPGGPQAAIPRSKQSC